MKTTLRYLNVDAQDTWHRQVEEQLLGLHLLTPITAAEVILEHLRETDPPFRAQIHLDLPGPAVHDGTARRIRAKAALVHGPGMASEGRDSTLEAALLKATQALSRKIQARKLRHLEREKSQLQSSANSGRWSHAPPGRRV